MCDRILMEHGDKNKKSGFCHHVLVTIFFTHISRHMRAVDALQWMVDPNRWSSNMANSVMALAALGSSLLATLFLYPSRDPDRLPREGPRPAKMQCQGGATGNFTLRPTPAKRRSPRRWAVRPPGTAWNAGGRR